MKKLILFLFLAITAIPQYCYSTTWNSSDKHADITLSNGDMTLDSASGSGWMSVRSTTSKASGKHYFEIVRDEGSYLILGVANSSASLSGYCGVDTNGWGWETETIPTKYHDGPDGSYGSDTAVSDVIQVALDLDNNKLWWGINNSWITGDPAAGTTPAYSSVSGDLYIMVSIADTNAAATLRTADADFSYSAPSGFTAWDAADNITINESTDSLADRRVIAYDDNEEGAIALSGSYAFGTLTPSHIEARVYEFGSFSSTIQINSSDWTQLTSETISGGSWSGTLSEIPKTNSWLGFQARISDDTDIESTEMANKMGVGYVVVYMGQSYINLWIGQGPYIPVEDEVSSDLCSKFRHLTTGQANSTPQDEAAYTGWALNTGDGSIYFANKLQSELDCPIGVLDYGMGGSALLEAYEGAYGYWVGSSATDNWYEDLQDGLAISEPISRRKANAAIWYQGYTDCNGNISYQDYYDGMVDLFGYLRTDTNFANLPIFVVSQPRCATCGNPVSFTAVRLAQYDICIDDNESKNIFAGQSIDQPLHTDGIHLSEDGQEAEALRYAQAVLWYEIGTGNYTYHRGPHAIAWKVIDSTHTDVYLSHDGGTDFTPTTGIDSFEVKISGTWRTTTGARTDARTIRLTCATSGTPTDVRCLYGASPTVTNVMVDNTALALPIEALGSFPILGTYGAQSY